MLAVYFLWFWLACGARAHLSLWAKGMYCLGGPVVGVDDMNSNAVVQPLYDLPQSQWWFHAFNGCDQKPPADGDVLELPAGGSFQGEMATNQAFTQFGFNGTHEGQWPDGVPAPVFPADGGCIGSPQLHAKNENDAAGTAMAIAYVSELEQVTQENLVVFSVRYHTPWEHLVSYDVPAAMPACPPGGCICAWGWVPNHCGQPNMYMTGFKCNVTGATSTVPVDVAKPPVWCEGNSTACTPGAKQMIYFNQQDGNNINVNNLTFMQADGQTPSPNYNMKLGFVDGAQNDIFVNDGSTPSTTVSTSTSAPPSTTATSVAVTTTSSIVNPTTTSMSTLTVTSIKVVTSTIVSTATSTSTTSLVSTTTSTKTIGYCPTGSKRGHARRLLKDAKLTR